MRCGGAYGTWENPSLVVVCGDIQYTAVIFTNQWPAHPRHCIQPPTYRQTRFRRDSPPTIIAFWRNMFGDQFFVLVINFKPTLDHPANGCLFRCQYNFQHTTGGQAAQVAPLLKSSSLMNLRSSGSVRRLRCAITNTPSTQRWQGKQLIG